MNSSTETIAGIYTLTDQETTLIIEIRQDELGTLSGSLTGTPEVAFEIAGRVQGEIGVGVCTDDKGGVYFEARPEGELLHFTIIEPDSTNMPDYNTAKEMVFTRQGPEVQRTAFTDDGADENGEADAELISHLSGTWVCDTGSKRTRATFSPDGTYRYHQETGHDGSPAHHHGDPDAVRSDYADDIGEWDARGDKERGVIIIRSSRGGKGRVEYQVRREDGQPHWNKYWLNRELFSRR